MLLNKSLPSGFSIGRVKKALRKEQQSVDKTKSKKDSGGLEKIKH